MWRRIEDINHFKSEVRELTHVAVQREISGGYFHHYLVSQVHDAHVEIIHYTPILKALKYFRIGKVVNKNVSLNDTSDLLDFESGVYFINSPDYPSSSHETEKARERAKKRLGEYKYSLFYNNCEHLVTWILTKQATCNQIEKGGIFLTVLFDLFTSVTNWSTVIKLAACDVVTTAFVTYLICEIVFSITTPENAYLAIFTNIFKTFLSVTASCYVTAAISDIIEEYMEDYFFYEWLKQVFDGFLNLRTGFRELCKHVTRLIVTLSASTRGHLIGCLIGTLIAPVYGSTVGAVLGRVTVTLLGRILGSVVVGQIFDILFEWVTFSFSNLRKKLSNIFNKKK